jgi:hypothetical protein
VKTLSDHTLIYDNECPMCSLYTNAFVKTGMLDEQGRQCYSQNLSHKIDLSRARNEIALVNRKTGEVIYGIDSLFKIVSNSITFLKPLFNSRVFRFLVSKFYSFISFNRKVIAPGKRFEAPGSCIPDFHAGYRMAYIIFAWIVSSLIFWKYSLWISSTIGFLRVLALAGIQIMLQFFTINLFRKDRAFHYLGNMMTISLAGAVALLPIINLNHFTSIPFWLVVGYFVLILTLMFFEHLRRLKLLELNRVLTFSWTLYWASVLTAIF